MRKYLIEKGYHKGNQLELVNIIDFFEKQFEAYQYASDVKMAKLITSHQDDIELLLPGSNSKSYQTWYSKFKEYLTKSNQLL